MNWLIRHFDIVAALLAASLAASFMPATAISNVVGELITFFGIQAAIILPAMVFTAGILKPEGLRLAEAKRYHVALRRQMMFWITLLILDFVVVVTLIFGKSVGWELVIPPIFNLPSIDFTWVLLAVAAFSGVLAVVRTVPFVRGVLSLLDMNAKMVIAAIEDRLEEKVAQDRPSQEPLNLPEGYGDVVEGRD